MVFVSLVSVWITIFEMVNKLGVEEALDHILLSNGIESHLQDDDEWEDEIIKFDDDLDLD